MKEVKGNKGFTLVEILIVVAVMAIVGAVGFTGWNLQTQKGRDARRKADLKIMTTAVENYFEDKNCYPTPEEMTCGSEAMEPYMTEVPCDPRNSAGSRYEYVRESCRKFSIYTKLDYTGDKAITDLKCEGGCGPNGEFNYYVSN